MSATNNANELLGVRQWRSELKEAVQTMLFLSRTTVFSFSRRGEYQNPRESIGHGRKFLCRCIIINNGRWHGVYAYS